MRGEHAIPANVVVDLDGTLIATDLLWESLVRYSTSKWSAPWNVLRWFVAGKARLKTELAERVDIDASLLPYKPEVVSELTKAKALGARLVLASASPIRHVQKIADHLGLFTGVLATEPAGPNLRSEAKAIAVDALLEGDPWSYYGDSLADVAVWRRAESAVIVDPPAAVSSAVGELGIPSRVIRTGRGQMTHVWARQLRIHQWAKNVLVALPLVTAHLWEPVAILHTVIAFFAFGLAASAVYLWNDLRDLDVDRAHPTKRMRPLASGQVRIPTVLGVAFALAVGALILAIVVGWLFLAALLVYVAVTTLYTVWLKRKLVADVVTLALLYTWRIVAGCAAILVVPSIWILAFSTFLFFSLAVMKRFAELVNHASHAHGRGYRPDDAGILASIGASAGIASVLVVVLYLDSYQVRALYTHPQVMWALVPLLLFWITRAWMLAVRKRMHDDPVVFAVTDRTSLVLAALAAAIVLIASL